MLPWQPFLAFYIWGAHWRHLKNTTEPSMCGGDAALCQITLTTCLTSLRVAKVRLSTCVLCYICDATIYDVTTLFFLHFTHRINLNFLITFCVSRGQRKMYCGHARLCVCLSVSVRGRMPTLLHGPGYNLGSGRGCPLVVHYWADLQSVHGLRCNGNITRTPVTSLRPSRDMTT